MVDGFSNMRGRDRGGGHGGYYRRDDHNSKLDIFYLTTALIIDERIIGYSIGYRGRQNAVSYDPEPTDPVVSIPSTRNKVGPGRRNMLTQHDARLRNSSTVPSRPPAVRSFTTMTNLWFPRPRRPRQLPPRLPSPLPRLRQLWLLRRLPR